MPNRKTEIHWCLGRIPKSSVGWPPNSRESGHNRYHPNRRINLADIRFSRAAPTNKPDFAIRANSHQRVITPPRRKVKFLHFLCRRINHSLTGVCRKPKSAVLGNRKSPRCPSSREEFLNSSSLRINPVYRRRIREPDPSSPIRQNVTG